MATSENTEVTQALKRFAKSSKNYYPYLRFDAFSMRDLINRKLSEDSSLTDHLYEGSNLSILVDIVSSMFESLAYNLNQSAAESMISDSNIYGNISRLVKFIGYSPAGYKASTVGVTVRVRTTDLSFLVVPKYSRIVLDGRDAYGSNIAFSTVNYHYINGGDMNKIPMVNGSWRHYSQTFTANGEQYEKFILDQINVEGTASEFVSYPYIDVYVKRPKGNGTYETIYFSAITDGIYFDSTDDSILSSKDNKFALRLNENKRYEIQFGDGIHGSMLKEGDIVHVVYLQSNGSDGQIGFGEIENRQMTVQIDGIKDEETGRQQLTLRDILELDTSFNNSIFSNAEIIGRYDEGETSYPQQELNGKTFFYGCCNTEKSSVPTVPETVEQIRENAPAHFRRSGRTITSDNFVAKVKEKFYADIVDCVVMNNHEYAATFYKWLWDVGNEKLGNPRKWINPSLTSLGTYGYRYSDAADQNNVYIWVKQEIDSTSVGSSIVNELQDEIPLTARPVVISAVDVKFAICAGYDGGVTEYGTAMTLRDYYNSSVKSPKDNFVFNDRGQNRLEIQLSSGTNISASIIKNRVLSIFKNFFSTSYMNIGSTVVIGDLESQILDIPGVERIRTIFRKLLPDGTYSSTDIIKKSGVCLAHWNDSIVGGYDIDTTNANVTLQKFQYPVFNDFSTIINQIDVIVDGSTNIVSE